MNFTSLLSAFGLAAVKAEARRAAQNFGKQAAIAGATVLLVLTAVGLALAALTVWLAGEVGTIWALLIVAGGLLVIAAILQLVVRMQSRKPASHRAAWAPRPSFTATNDPGAPPPGGVSFSATTGEAPPMGSVIGSAAIVAIVGFILARQLGKK
jgi:Ca2+/H+ antiporter